MWRPVARATAASPGHTIERRISTSSNSSDDTSSIFSATRPYDRAFSERPRFDSLTPLTSADSSFNAGADSVYQHDRQNVVYQESLYPDLSNLVHKTEGWGSRLWVNLSRTEMPGEEESRIWGDITGETKDNTSPRPKTLPCKQTPIPPANCSNSSDVQQANGDEDGYPTEVDSFEGDVYSTDPEDSEFDVDGGGVTLDCFEDFDVEENAATERRVDVESSASSTSEESEYEDDEVSALLQGLDMSSYDRPGIYKLSKLPFWAQYEATRIALHCGIPLSNKNLSDALSPDLDKLHEACQAGDLQRSWHKVMGEFASRRERTLPKQRISAGLWSALQRQAWGKNVYMTGQIHFNSSPDQPTFSMRLNALGYQSSNRFWRKFGSDRFLTLRLPSPPNPNHLPSATGFHRRALCKTPQKFNESLVQFLMQEEGVEVLGRIWKLFYVRDVKVKKQDVFQAILFAVKGEGIELEDEWEIEEVLNWHMPLIPKNLRSTVPKLWSRISLGLTKTVDTVYFTTDQICPDPKNPRKPGDPYTPDPNVENVVGNVKGECMDDGCSTASPALFLKIQEKLGYKEAPTAVQGRLEGAKGLWIVDPIALDEVSRGIRDPDEMWIRVNESQAKYQGHQGPGQELDRAWTTLDFASCSHPPRPANVNLQLLAILDHGGVPFEPLRDLVDNHLELIIQELDNAMDHPALLRNWIYTNGRLSNSRAQANKIVFQGGCPAAPAERLLMWLEAGFHPQTQGYVMNELQKMIEGFWEKLKEKMHIRIPLSTILFCVADPTGTLKEGEVSLQFSRGIADPRTGRRRNFIDGDILVARNPAQLPSDVQKVRAVNNEHLRELKDVIVFSTQGLRSLASLLSGGDYDGDKCWVCWDPQIVEPFQKGGQVPKDFEGEDEWFTRYKECVHDLPRPELSQTQLQLCKRITPEQMRVGNAFIRAGALYTLNSEPGMLGIYANCHERYARQFGLGDELSIELAQLCAALVDAPKQGLCLKPDHKRIRDSKFKQRGYRDNPGQKPPAADPDDRSAKITARLDGFAQTKIAQRKVEFEKRKRDSPFSDGHLTQMFRDEDERSQTDPEIKQCLRFLQSELHRVRDKWHSLGHGGGDRWDGRNGSYGNSSLSGGLTQYTMSSSQSDEDDTFGNKVESSYAEYFLIKPLPEGQTTTHPVISRWMKDAEKPSSEWQLLKASTAFRRWGGESAIVWYLAGQQLCELKARASGRARFVVEDIYQSLKSDRTFLRRREEDIITLGGIKEEEEQEDVWYDFETDFE